MMRNTLLVRMYAIRDSLLIIQLPYPQDRLEAIADKVNITHPQASLLTGALKGKVREGTKVKRAIEASLVGRLEASVSSFVDVFKKVVKSSKDILVGTIVMVNNLPLVFLSILLRVLPNARSLEVALNGAMACPLR